MLENKLLQPDASFPRHPDWDGCPQCEAGSGGRIAREADFRHLGSGQVRLFKKQTDLGLEDLTQPNRATGRRHLMRLPLEETRVTIGSSRSVNLSSGILDRVEARGVGFSEMQSYWSLPFHDFAVVGDVTVMRDKHKRPLYDDIHIVTSNPVVLFSMKASGDNYTSMTLHHFFDTRRQNLIPR